jgi:hypothetical protein
LRAKIDLVLMLQFVAVPNLNINSTRFLFRTGNVPGCPRQTGQTFVLGGALNSVEHEQKALLFVFSCACTSSPITGSYFEYIGSNEFIFLGLPLLLFNVSHESPFNFIKPATT